MQILESLKWGLAQKLELIWWKRYLKKQHIKDYLDWKKSYWSVFLDEISWGYSIKKSDRILDAGCGPAGIFSILPQKQTTALDPLLEKYESDLPHFNYKMYPDVSFISIPFEQYSEDENYNLIFCLNAINHFKDFQFSVFKLQDLLLPGGFLILSIDVHRFEFVKHLFRLLPGDALHPQQHSRKNYLDVLLSNGKLRLIKTFIKDKGRVFNYEILILQRIS